LSFWGLVCSQREFLSETTGVYESTRARMRDATTDLITALRNALQSDGSVEPDAAASDETERTEALRVIRSALESLDGAVAAAAAVTALQAAVKVKESGAVDSKTCKECVAVYGASMAEKGMLLLGGPQTLADLWCVCVCVCVFKRCRQ